MTSAGQRARLCGSALEAGNIVTYSKVATKSVGLCATVQSQVLDHGALILKIIFILRLLQGFARRAAHPGDMFGATPVDTHNGAGPPASCRVGLPNFS